jgi:shikimate kinase
MTSHRWLRRQRVPGNRACLDSFKVAFRTWRLAQSRIARKGITGRRWGPSAHSRKLAEVAKVLITGMFGTGKSAALERLQERGHAVVDTDTGAFSQWVTLPDGSADWIWREQAITDLLSGHRDGHLFVAGCKTNQGRFYSMFDHIVLLSAPAEAILARIQTRTNNPYGKRPEETAILDHLATVEPLLRATTTAEIDAAAPIEQVVDQLEGLTKRPKTP